MESRAEVGLRPGQPVTVMLDSMCGNPAGIVCSQEEEGFLPVSAGKYIRRTKQYDAAAKKQIITFIVL